MGSNKMLQVALGKTEADEYRTNLSLLSDRLKGHVGLFFTTLERDEVGPRAGGRGWAGERRP
jgi:mRNA turnover protein 4